MTGKSSGNKWRRLGAGGAFAPCQVAHHLLIRVAVSVPPARGEVEILQELIKRRIPQILGIYLAIGWGVLEFLDWLTGRYNLSPAVADISLAVWIGMVPTVLLLAYLHGEKGVQPWTRVEKIGIPANVLAVGALLAFMFSGKGWAHRAGAEDLELDPTRIAVLYFEDDSEDRDLGHLASAFTGALIDELTRVGPLDVISRGGVKPYRESYVPLDSLVRALRMGTLVEGSVSGSKERLTLSVSLIDPASQSIIDSFTLDGTVADWLDVRDELAKEVGRALRQRLGIEIRLRERRAGTESAQALERVVQAEKLRVEAERLEATGDTAAAARELTRADSLLAGAEALDPAWAEPIVLRGWVARDRGALSSLGPGTLVQEDVLRGLWHAERALALEPGDARALELRGILRYAISESPRLSEPAELRTAAEEDLLAAVAADPSRARAWSTLSTLHRVSARHAEAKRDAERALEADPFLRAASTITFRLYETSLELREIDESARWCSEGRRRFPDDYTFVACSLFLLALPGGPEPDVERAWALADTVLRLSAPQQHGQLRLLGQVWVAAAIARAGLADSAVAVSERARAAASGPLKPWIDYSAANVQLLAGRRDAALALLADFLAEVPQRKEYIASDWTFEALWDDPRFQALVAPDTTTAR